jgi:hypothetical protein
MAWVARLIIEEEERKNVWRGWRDIEGWCMCRANPHRGKTGLTLIGAT